MELICRADHRVGHHRQAPAVQQGSPDLPHREVERIGVELRPHLIGTQLESEVQPREELGHIAVRDRDALGQPGGSGGVDDVRDVVGSRSRKSCRDVVFAISSVDIQHRHAEAGDLVDQFRGGDDCHRCRVGAHELDAIRGQRRVDRQVRRPGLEHRQDRDDRIGRAWEHQGHSPSRARAVGGQRVRQPV